MHPIDRIFDYESSYYVFQYSAVKDVYICINAVSKSKDRKLEQSQKNGHKMHENVLCGTDVTIKLIFTKLTDLLFTFSTADVHEVTIKLLLLN